MIIPWQDIEPETLTSILESFVLREGTDYGEKELSLKEKIFELKEMLIKNKIQIVWSELHESIDIQKIDRFKS